MSKNLLALGGITAFFAATVAPVSPAVALSASDCGDAPTGGTMSTHGSGCELTFSEAGDYSWTLPAGASDVYAMLVGGGGGAYVNSDASVNGYAGAGGEVAFADLTDATAGDVVEISVGAGGASNGSTPTAGEDSVVSAGGSDHTAAGGDPGSLGSWLFGFCNPGVDGYFGEAPGAGTAGTPPTGESCTGGQPGIQPSTDPSTPTVFQDDTTEYGHGGGVVLNDGDRVYTWGSGASMAVGSGVSYNDGVRGFVSLRFSVSVDESSTTTSSDELASTGNSVPVGNLAGFSIVALLAGVGAMMGRRLRQPNQ